MRSVYDALYDWARRTTTSFTELITSGFDKDDALQVDDGDELIYRLKQWPDLAPGQKTAHIYRALSVMSNRPVNRRWLLAHARLAPDQLDRLIDQLVADEALEVIDASRFGND
jgi:hypothetical protein